MWLLDRKKELPDLTHKTVISPLHYGETIEIALSRGIEGETYINGKRFVFERENVFFIPPRQPHTSFYKKGGSGDGDMIAAFHINVEALALYIDVKKLLLADGRGLSGFPNRFSGFDFVLSAIERIMDESHSLAARLSELLSLLAFFSENAGDDGGAEYNRASVRIADWIEAHYKERLSVANAAAHFGFSKFYFCKWFKAHTGVTFSECLNAVRISHASIDLAHGFSVEETAARCGFTDPSYFIKVFKRYRGTTPKTYTATE